MSLDDVKPLLVDYVIRNSNVCNIEWAPNISEKLLFDPFEKSYAGRKKTAHYFLLVAALTDTMLIGRAENSRALMIHIHKLLGDALFEEDSANHFMEMLLKSIYYDDLGSEKEKIPEVLASVNRFVQTIAGGDLIQYAEKFPKPKGMVSEIAQYVERMGGQFIEKPWMYMQWMTRPYPDLEVFKNFSPIDLYIPMTSYIKDVAHCLELCPRRDHGWWKDSNNVEKARERLTELGRELFPEDPAKIDYPFYLLGRWIRGRRLSLKLLQDYLLFFEDIYKKTRTVPVTYDIVSRKMSNFEENLRAELEKMNIMFYYESHRFNLPTGLTYLPDFVLPECKIKNKTVLLEPHGVWSYPQRRRAKIGHRIITLQAYGVKRDESETQFTKKIRLFRETFGRDYYLILFVPARVKERVETWYPNSYDEIYEGTDIPKLLYKLKQYSK